MTRSDTAKVLLILRAAYPQFYSNVTAEEANEITNLWTEMFTEYDVDVVKVALKRLIKTHGGFPPTIADVEDQIQQLISVARKEPTNEELWQMLRNGIMDGRNGAEEHFEKFPDVLKRYCGSPEWLRNHADYDLNVFDTVEKAQFMKQIGEMKKRIQYEVNGDVQKMLGAAYNKMRYDPGKQISQAGLSKSYLTSNGVVAWE